METLTLKPRQEVNEQIESELVLRALGKSVVAVDVLDVSIEPALSLSDDEGARSRISNNSQGPQPCQQSYSCFSSQQSTRCSHGCHTPQSHAV